MSDTRTVDGWTIRSDGGVTVVATPLEKVEEQGAELTPESLSMWRDGGMPEVPIMVLRAMLDMMVEMLDIELESIGDVPLAGAFPLAPLLTQPQLTVAGPERLEPRLVLVRTVDLRARLVLLDHDDRPYLGSPSLSSRRPRRP